MKIGCVVGSLAQARIAAEIGCDYLEIKGEVLLCSDQDYEAIAKAVKSLRAPVEALTSPIPRELGLKIVGEDANLDAALVVFEKIISRAGQFGVKVITFGCSKARTIGPNTPRHEAYEQLYGFLRTCADICRSHNMVIGVESLNRSETNVLNSPMETKRFLEQLNIPEVGMTFDSYHVESESLNLRSELECASDLILHAHTCDADRRCPNQRSEAVAKFIKELSRVGYQGRVSLECNFTSFRKELSEALPAISRMITDNAISH